MDLGYQIVQRNWRHRSGEIDLVAMDGQCLVFVEVKTRSTLVYGAPVEAVGPAKLARMRQLAGLYLQTQQPAAESVRLDVIAVTTGGGPRQVEHYLGVGQ
ncbi:MAG: YraN family protein [Micrococcales bacterium]|nr:YraN family protein [Micrococcales bacterium]